jgi:mRNA interferase MazF
VLVVTRDAAIPALSTVIVAPVTTRVRTIPTEIPLGEADGLREPCAASFDNLLPIPTRSLTTRVAGESHARRRQICRALAALADC